MSKYRFRTDFLARKIALTTLLIASSINASKRSISDSILKVVLRADIALLSLDQPPPLHELVDIIGDGFLLADVLVMHYCLVCLQDCVD